MATRPVTVSVKHECEVVREDEHILFPSSDPLAIKTDDEDYNSSEVETKVKEEPEDNYGERRPRKIFIKVERKSSKERKSGGGRPRKYATDEERGKVKVERVRQHRAKTGAEREERLQKQREKDRRRKAEMSEEKREERLRRRRELHSKRRAKMTKEEHEEMLRKERELHSKRRAKMKKEEHEEMLRKQREKDRERRTKMTKEEHEEMLRKQRERYRERRAKMKKEEHEEFLRKQRELYSKRRAKMTKVEHEEFLRKHRELHSKRRAKMTKEDHDEFLRKRRERRAKMKKAAEVLENVTVMAAGHSGEEDSQSTTTPGTGTGTVKKSQSSLLDKHEEKKRKMREYSKRRKEENPEKYKELKKKYRESSKKQREIDPEKYEKYIKRLQRNRANPAIRKKKEETEEEKELRKMRRRLQYRKQRETEEGREMMRFRQYSRIQMQIAQMTDEELAAYKAKQSEAAKKWRENLSGEKLERYREKIRNYHKQYYKQYYKDPERAEQRRKRFNALLRQRCAQETPEQRQKRLRRYKINQTITKMRKQWEDQGMPQEEVERRLTELKSQMQAEPLPPPETLSTYKPRIKTDVSYTPLPPPKRRVRRSGRQPSSSLQIDSSSESTIQNGMGSTENDNSNNFDDDGFQCDASDDVGNEITQAETEPVPVIQFDIKCPHCPSTYSERSDLISHISSEHSEICWKCPKCKIIVLSSDELSEHFKAEHLFSKRTTDTTASKGTSSMKGYNFTCIKCDPVNSQDSKRTFQRVKDLMEHVKSSHPDSFWPCSKCNLLKYTKSSLNTHKKVCHQTEKTIKTNGKKRLVKN